jgi:uncharacterized protein
MIIPDINLLVYAYNADSRAHIPAKIWWEESLNSSDISIGIPTAVLLGFIRIVTHPRVFPSPIDAAKAVSYVQSWLTIPHVELLTPGPNHFSILKDLVSHLGSAGSMTTDAHVAAFAVENSAVVYSNDMDFLRFPQIKTKNPLRN